MLNLCAAYVITILKRACACLYPVSNHLKLVLDRIQITLNSSPSRRMPRIVPMVYPEVCPEVYPKVYPEEYPEVHQRHSAMRKGTRGPSMTSLLYM